MNHWPLPMGGWNIMDNSDVASKLSEVEIEWKGVVSVVSAGTFSCFKLRQLQGSGLARAL